MHDGWANGAMGFSSSSHISARAANFSPPGRGRSPRAEEEGRRGKGGPETAEGGSLESGGRMGKGMEGMGSTDARGLRLRRALDAVYGPGRGPGTLPDLISN
jgi:hypothetical protein